jgi:hypothetical protein
MIEESCNGRHDLVCGVIYMASRMADLEYGRPRRKVRALDVRVERAARVLHDIPGGAINCNCHMRVLHDASHVEAVKLQLLSFHAAGERILHNSSQFGLVVRRWWHLIDEE